MIGFIILMVVLISIFCFLLGSAAHSGGLAEPEVGIVIILLLAFYVGLFGVINAEYIYKEDHKSLKQAIESCEEKTIQDLEKTKQILEEIRK